MFEDKAQKIAHAIETYFGPDHILTDQERTIVERAIHRKTLSRDPYSTLDQKLTLGQKLADAVAKFGGSWEFIIAFGVFLLLWTGFNAVSAQSAFDPYPFIFLNLLLSMLAAIQAPVIMMSQNRQAAKDREVSAHDYEINLKSEIEIMALHEKLDQMRTAELRELIVKQQEQIDLLTKITQGHLKIEESK
jgi:uncharacterized membrane protein